MNELAWQLNCHRKCPPHPPPAPLCLFNSRQSWFIYFLSTLYFMCRLLQTAAEQKYTTQSGKKREAFFSFVFLVCCLLVYRMMSLDGLCCHLVYFWTNDHIAVHGQVFSDNNKGDLHCIQKGHTQMSFNWMCLVFVLKMFQKLQCKWTRKYLTEHKTETHV